jgi:hypothetical protein
MRGGEEGGCGVSANDNSCAHHVTWSPAQINFGDLSPYLTYVNIGTMGSASVPYYRKSFIVYFFGGLLCVGHSFVYVVHFYF